MSPELTDEEINAATTTLGIDEKVVQVLMDGRFVFVKTTKVPRANGGNWQRIEFQYWKNNPGPNDPPFYNVEAFRSLDDSKIAQSDDCSCPHRQRRQVVCKHLKALIALLSGDVPYHMVIVPKYEFNVKA